MEETSKHGVLGRHQSFSEERIEVLSDTIERHHSLWNTPSLLYPESCSDGNWRSHCRTGRPVVCSEGAHRSSNQEIETRSSSDCKNFNLDADAKHYRTVRPVVCSERAPQTRSFHDWKSIDLDEETNYDRTERPVVCSQQERSMSEGVDIDFRVSGLPHSVVKQVESFRVRELIKKIENHPHRQDLQFDLRQNKAYNPFSAKSKKMIKDVGNVELFGLFETDPKTQCKACLSYWSEGIVYCTCGHLLRETVANRSFMVYTLDLRSIPEYVIKKGRPHGHRYGKAPENKEYHLAHNLKKRCIKWEFTGIHDRFLLDHVFRERMVQHNRDEEVCRAWDILAEEDHTYRMSESEHFHYRQNWWISLNKSGNNTQPLRKRSGFNQALSTLNRLHQESGERPLRPLPYWKYQERQPSSSSSSPLLAMERILVVFLRIQRKSIKEVHAKVYDRTGQPVVYRTLAKTSDEWLSRLHSFFWYR